MTRRSAFTLVELLIVLAIVVVLASVLFPVLASARASARKAVCISNFRQAAISTGLYLSDYNDTYMPSSYLPGQNTNSRNDRTWVQLVMPYVKDFRLFRCPADDTDRPRREATFDQDLVPGDTYSQYYTASLRTNLGYNHIYFSPTYRKNGLWESRPRTASEVSNANNTLLFIDSRWNVTAGQQEPTGGGSYLVIPPCRYEERGVMRMDTFKITNDPNVTDVFTAGTSGWKLDQRDDPLVFGGAWPWHQGFVTVARADCSVKMYRPEQLTVGCEQEPNWQGNILNPQLYMWDLR